MARRPLKERAADKADRLAADLEALAEEATDKAQRKWLRIEARMATTLALYLREDRGPRTSKRGRGQTPFSGWGPRNS